jgi:hypothetical protein
MNIGGRALYTGIGAKKLKSFRTNFFPGTPTSSRMESFEMGHEHRLKSTQVMKRTGG